MLAKMSWRVVVVLMAMVCSLPADAQEADGEVVFEGKYVHNSRGQLLGEPSVTRVIEKEDGARVVETTFRGVTETAVVNAGGEFVAYDTVKAPEGDNPGYSIALSFDGDEVMATRRGVREDWTDQPLEVPAETVFDPNSRPDTYTAAWVLFPKFEVAPGEAGRFHVYDWDNSGNGLADYEIAVMNLGKEKVQVPAGEFEANRIVVYQLTSADTWFKKRAGHVTDFWVTDDGKIVRVYRHREPYEMVLSEIVTE